MKMVEAAQDVVFGKMALFRDGQVRAYFTNDLVFGTIVFIKVCLWCVAAWTSATVLYIAFKTASGRLYGFTVLPLYVRDVFMVISWFKMDDSGEIVHFEFLVFRGMGIIKDPLFQLDVSANEV